MVRQVKNAEGFYFTPVFTKTDKLNTDEMLQ